MKRDNVMSQITQKTVTQNYTFVSGNGIKKQAQFSDINPK